MILGWSACREGPEFEEMSGGWEQHPCRTL